MLKPQVCKQKSAFFARVSLDYQVRADYHLQHNGQMGRAMLFKIAKAAYGAAFYTLHSRLP